MPLGSVPTLIFGSTGSTVVEGGGALTRVVCAFCAPNTRGTASENDSARGKMRFVMDEAARWSGPAERGPSMKDLRSGRQQECIRRHAPSVSFQFAYGPSRSPGPQAAGAAVEEVAHVVHLATQRKSIDSSSRPRFSNGG